MAEKRYFNKDVTYGPWPKGVDNRTSEYELPVDTLRAGINVDITNKGRARRRKGLTYALTAPGCHSTFAYKDLFLFVRDGDLYMGLPPDEAILYAGVGPARMSYVTVNEEIYFSNGSIKSKVDADGNLNEWGVPIPNPIPNIAASPGGNLFAGRYQLAMTYTNAAGEEGGAAIMSAVTAAGDDKIDLTNLPVASGLQLNLYMTDANGRDFHRVITLAEGATTYTVLGSAPTHRQLQTKFLEPFPPCTQLEHYRGIIYGVIGNLVVHTQPLRYGLYDPRKDFIPFSEDVGMIKGHTTGLYISADKTYWLGGGGPADFKQDIVFDFPAVPGTGVYTPHDDNLIWFSEKGFVRGRDGGQADLLTDEQLAVSKYSRGVLLFREQGGIRQVVSALAGETASEFPSEDRVTDDTVRSTS